MLKVNKIYCEDALDRLKKLDKDSIDLVILDPPYNIQIDEWDKLGDTEKYIKWIEEVIDEITKRIGVLENE